LSKHEWSEGRIKSFIVSTLRSGARRWPPKFETLKEACVGKKLNKTSNRQALHYKCNKCKKEFPQKDVQVDHIFPVVGPEGFIDWNTFIERLFCPKENLQVLCSKCHTAKTNKEKKQRKKNV